MPMMERTCPVIGEKPMSAMARPNAAVSRPFTIAPLLSSATVAIPSRESRKNSAELNSFNTSRATGSMPMRTAAPMTPPMSEET